MNVKQAKRTFVIAPRMSGKMAMIETEAKITGAVILEPGGGRRWDGEKWIAWPAKRS